MNSQPCRARSGGRSIASAAVHVPAAPSATCDDPLTLSQLPPRKVEARAVQEPISPIRVSNKRPTSPDDSSEPRKREKRTHPAKPQSKSKADSLNSGRDKARKRKGARSRKPPSQEKSVNNQSHKENDGHVSGIRHLPITDRPNGLLPAQKPTKPIEFHFKSELRLNVRRAEHAESSRTTLKQSANRYANPIPDFKALHAAQDASLAARREHIRRLVPPPLELNTEVRAREREKFEETRRAREQEIQREMEERRRQKEIEEEKEIRELRKRAVPKANAIPDWYADAPKKKGAVSRARSDVA
ncbi:hypothetical protein NEOLEDRAFT_1126667 [Neolentinus lepideus HHB14362 ss-1]|uniref:TPX2 C-terminal domain-containing protein n=1 Tax=Neolentinus lepideus HHB14362 ss-1 TaxID=1314782 RepID=A0A165WCE2_9AGAM|nr:hypothetical protein NEOLEDRAFT_1126667 [Neolentinus lepideus HHB14362 ss-1]